MAIKVTLFFSSFRQAWQEAYLWNVSAPSPTASQQLTDLVNARCALLGIGASLLSVRESNVPANRQVLDIDPSQFVPAGTWPGGNPTVFGAAQTNLSLVVKCTTGTGQKLVYLAGFPAGLVRADPTFPQNVFLANVPGFGTLLGQYLKVLTNGVYGCRTWQTTVRLPALGLQMGTQTPPLVGVQLAALQPWTVGQKVLVSGWRRQNPRFPGLTGVYTLAGVPPANQVAPPFVYYLFQTQEVAANNFKSIGTIGLANFTFTAFTVAIPDKAVSRKRGGRVLLPLGRSSTGR